MFKTRQSNRESRFKFPRRSHKPSGLNSDGNKTSSSVSSVNSTPELKQSKSPRSRPMNNIFFTNVLKNNHNIENSKRTEPQSFDLDAMLLGM